LKRSLLSLLALSLLAMQLTACGTRLESGSSGEDVNRTLSGTGGNSGLNEVDSSRAGTGTVNAMTDPNEVRKFLDANKIANGDVYLQDEKVYINIVGLNEKISRFLVDRYKIGTYQTVNVAHSIEELQDAQQKLTALDLYSKLNLYSSDLDVIKNRIIINLPDTS
jgi:predicted small secreted protein